MVKSIAFTIMLIIMFMLAKVGKISPTQYFCVTLWQLKKLHEAFEGLKYLY